MRSRSSSRSPGQSASSRAGTRSLLPTRSAPGGSVAEMTLAFGLTRRQTSGSRPQALPTSRDSKGNILVHFIRLPLVETRGCWYYRAEYEDWGWNQEGIDYGVDRLNFPACDALLQERIAVLLPHEFSQGRVEDAIRDVRLELPEECSSPAWSLRPEGLRADRDCGVPGKTGITPEGGLVVHWDRERRPPDNSVCWVLWPGADAWQPYYRQR